MNIFETPAPIFDRAARNPGSTVTVELDPSHPDAIRLDELYRALPATWKAEAKARRAFQRAHSGEGDYHPELKAHSRAAHARNLALCELKLAVVEVSGMAKPTEDRWEKFGLSLAVVRVANRLYVVLASDQAEYHNPPEDLGILECVIVEL